MVVKGKDAEKLDEFLSKVDEIESLVKTLKYGEGEDVKHAMKQADDIIAKAQVTKGKVKDEEEETEEELPETKTGFSKTMINTASGDPQSPGYGQQAYDPNDQSAFMAAMETDAKERAERRKLREKEANELKEKGNYEFHQGNYEKALDLYTEGLQKIKDHTALWTNRAQTNIKLLNYEEAIKDCEWALKVFPNSLKAHIHMGRAYLGLKQFDKSRECFKQALQCDPKKEGMINEYLAEVDRTERITNEEEQAAEFFKTGEANVVNMLEKILKPDQLPIYYSGGFRIMCTCLKRNDEKTLFRSKAGFSIVNEHACFSRCFSASPRSLSQEELDMLTSAIDMFVMACVDNDANQQTLLQTEGFPDKLLRFTEVKMKGQGRILKASCIDLLHTVTLSDVGRSTVMQKFDVPRLLTVIFNLIRTNANVAVTTCCVLNNLCLDKKFKQLLRDKIEKDVLPAFETLLRDGSSHHTVLPTCVSTMTNLAGDSAIRSKLCDRKDLWKILIDLVTNHKEKLQDPVSIELVEASLGLISNMTHESSQYLREFGVNVCKQCLAVCKNLKHYKVMVSRGLGILSHVLPNSIPSVDWFCENGGVDVLLYILKNDDDFHNRKCSLKALTGCTQINDHARLFIVDHKGLGTLIKLLKSDDETVVGNAALSLSHCTQVKKVCAALTNTDIIKDLLVLARDGKKPGLQQNCAILLAKLAQGDKRHLERLRELHGIEILHTCMQYLK